MSQTTNPHQAILFLKEPAMLSPIEKKILQELRAITKNPKLKESDLLEWSSSEETVKASLEPSDLYIYCPGIGVHCAIPKISNKNPNVTQ